MPDCTGLKKGDIVHWYNDNNNRIIWVTCCTPFAAASPQMTALEIT
jgi:hypothetical protein